MTHLTGTTFNVQRFSTEDGPGIRTTVFFKGCPLHCAWCHNPEGMSRDPELIWYDERRPDLFTMRVLASTAWAFKASSGQESPISMESSALV